MSSYGWDDGSDTAIAMDMMPEMPTVLSRFLAHAPIAEKPHFEKIWKIAFVLTYWRMRLYSDRGACAPILDTDQYYILGLYILGLGQYRSRRYTMLNPIRVMLP